ncbi:MAG: LysM peptidoglycan-binding domain-containing protein [Candidatus Latescibacter sp.]|nr:LysM peptidoglycan-binding domain-containing protein [Candidatus Latescibacter sp.]
MKNHTLGIALSFFLLTAVGCSAPAVKSITSSVPKIKQNESTLTFAPVDPSNIQKYEHEESLLAHILAYYDKVIAAHREGDFGLAETLVDSAFVLYGKVNLDEINNQSLVTRFNTTVSALAHEYGVILQESDEIAREDPGSWIADLSNLEQFKSGQWSFEELKDIVNKISRKSDVPIDFNEKVRNCIYYFQTKGHDVMARWQSRSGRYIPMMQKIFAEEDLPVDLVYLSMIESGLNPRAVSRARAVGLWQFIYTTGKLYGLERNEWIDERRDVLKSTKAAAQHLQDLFKLYDDWNLVMAAYNCGAGRVSRSTQQSGLNDYWRIDLPKETDNYVPMYMAALIISKAPEIFGFQNIEKEPPYAFDTAEVRPYTKIDTAAKCAGVDAEALKDLNSELTREYTPGGKDVYQLKIPKGSREKFIVEYAKIPEEKIKTVSVAKGYTIRKGDTISKVARKYGITISSLLAANNLKQGAVLKIGQKLNIPGSVDTVEIAVNTEKASPAKAEPEQKKTAKGVLADTQPDHITYIVQENDSLYVIAQKYAVSYKDIMVWNKIRNPRMIKPGDKLLIKTKG